MKSVFTWKWLTLASVAAITALAGCQNPPVESAEDVAEELNEAAPADHPAFGDRGPRGDHRPGPAFLLRAALRDLDLTDAQKTAIQGEIDALEAAKPARGEGFEADRKALADAVRAGNVDASKLGRDFAPPAEMKAAVTKAIQALHDTLDAKQRRALVDKMAAHMEHPKDGMERRGRGGPDGERGPRPDGAGERGARPEGGPMMHMLSGLDLTADQQTRVKAALEGLAPSDADREAMKAAHEAHRKEMATRMEAFVADKFDASAFATPPADKQAFGPKQHMVKALAAVVPILTADQRAKLADQIEKGPMGPMHHGKHGKRAPAARPSR